MKEEILSVTIKRFTSRDGTVFTAEGPSKSQENAALNQCKIRDIEYDFLHFKVDDNKLKEYNDDNWLHFKWKFFREYLQEKYWMNGWIYRGISLGKKWMNDLTKKEFEDILINAFVNESSHIDFPVNSWRDERFINIIMNSGVLPKEILTSKKRDGLSNLLIYLSRYRKIEKLKEAIEKGLIAIDTKSIIHCVWNGASEERDNEKKMQGTKGCIYPVGFQTKPYFFQYNMNQKNREFIKFVMMHSIDSKDKILAGMLNMQRFFVEPTYAGISIYYEVFHNKTMKQSDILADRTYSFFLWALRDYKKPKNIKPDTDLFEAMKLSWHDLNYEINMHMKEVYDYLLPIARGKEIELEIYFYWITNGGVNWGMSHKILNKKFSKEHHIRHNYKLEDIIKENDVLVKNLEKNKKALADIDKKRELLAKKEKEILSIY